MMSRNVQDLPLSDWEPFQKCAPEERQAFQEWMELGVYMAPKSLGAVCVIFQHLDPARQFLLWDQNNPEHDPTFADALLNINRNKSCPHNNLNEFLRCRDCNCDCWSDLKGED